MESRVASSPRRPNPKVQAAVWGFIALAAAWFVARMSWPLLAEPLRGEVRTAVHISGWVLGGLVLIGLLVFKFWIKPRLPTEAAERIRQAEERSQERRRSAGPAQAAALLVFALALAVGYLLKFYGLVTDKRALYACSLAVMIALSLALVGWTIWRGRA